MKDDVYFNLFQSHLTLLCMHCKNTLKCDIPTHFFPFDICSSCYMVKLIYIIVLYDSSEI